MKLILARLTGIVAVAAWIGSGCDTTPSDEGEADGGMSKEDSGSGPGTEDSEDSETDSEGGTDSGDVCSDSGSPEPPDTTGWEEATIDGIYIQSFDFEAYPYNVYPCSVSEKWCVYWNVPPYVETDCKGNVQLTGRLSPVLGEEELCNAVVGVGYSNRAFVIETVDSISECDNSECQPDRGHCNVPQPVCGACE